MRYLILGILLVLMPSAVLALDYSDCDAGTEDCICLPYDTLGIDEDAVTTITECRDACAEVAPYEYLNHGEVTSYSAQCNVDGLLTTLSQGDIDEEVEYSDRLDYDWCDDGTEECLCLPEAPFDIDQSQVGSVADCQSVCVDLEAAEHIYGGDITYFSAQCDIGGVSTTLAEGGIDDEINYATEDGLSTDGGDTLYSSPTLSVDIPGLEFTPAYKEGDVIKSSYIGEYIAAVYGWILASASLLAIVMLMLGGLQYMLARGKPEAIGKAKTRIKNAITGIVLLFGAFTIAFMVDPGTTIFDSMNITYIDKSEWYEEEIYSEIIVPSEEISGEVEKIRGEYILDYSEDKYLNPAAVAALENAGNTLYENEGVRIKVTSARRTVTKQAELFYDNCLSNSTKSCTVLTCNPASGMGIISGNSSGYTYTGELAGETSRTAVINAIVSHANLANCPHTSSVAVDVWCDDGGSNFVHEPSCHKAMSEAMVANGFCRIAAEAWHFELNSMHVCGDCSTANVHSYTLYGTTYTPDLSCDKWDYKNNQCQ